MGPCGVITIIGCCGGGWTELNGGTEAVLDTLFDEDVETTATDADAAAATTLLAATVAEAAVVPDDTEETTGGDELAALDLDAANRVNIFIPAVTDGTSLTGAPRPGSFDGRTDSAANRPSPPATGPPGGVGRAGLLFELLFVGATEAKTEYPGAAALLLNTNINLLSIALPSTSPSIILQ